MAKFTDSKGREWSLSSNAAAVKRIREATGVSLTKLTNGDLAGYAEVQIDTEKLADVLFAWCAGQNPDVTREAFAEQVIDGETIHAARLAMDEAFLLFYPSRQREAMRAMAAKQESMTEAAMTAMTEAMRSPSTGTATSSTTATGSPESSASTPPGSPSAN